MNVPPTVGQRVEAARLRLVEVEAMLRLLPIGEADRCTGHDEAELSELALKRLTEAQEHLFWITMLPLDAQQTLAPDDDQRDAQEALDKERTVPS